MRIFQIVRHHRELILRRRSGQALAARRTASLLGAGALAVAALAATASAQRPAVTIRASQ
jgi:hypothetical protein